MACVSVPHSRPDRAAVVAENDVKNYRVHPTHWLISHRSHDVAQRGLMNKAFYRCGNGVLPGDN